MSGFKKQDFGDISTVRAIPIEDLQKEIDRLGLTSITPSKKQSVPNPGIVIATMLGQELKFECTTKIITVTHKESELYSGSRMRISRRDAFELAAWLLDSAANIED